MLTQIICLVILIHVALFAQSASPMELGSEGPSIHSKYQIKESAAARTCRISGGTNWYVSSHDDLRVLDIQLCLFSESVIDGRTFFYNQIEQPVRPTALKVYFEPLPCASHSCTTPDTYCTHSGGEIQVLKDTESRSFHLCAFPDNSSIGLNTLWKGPEAAENAHLTSALKK